jgi:hypothetical protein
MSDFETTDEQIPPSSAGEDDTAEVDADGSGTLEEDATLEADAAEISAASARVLSGSELITPVDTAGGPDATEKETATDESSDAEWSESAGDEASAPGEARVLPFDREVSAKRIAGELRRIESEVRRFLDDHDTRRKRKLAGTRRWNELEEDIIQWKFSGRVDDGILRQMHALVMRRHHLFNRLRFLAFTRPTWNS